MELKGSVLEKMKQILGEKDLFLISINYICEEKEKNRWKQAIACVSI